MKILYTALGPLAVLLSTLAAVRSEEGRRNRGFILHQMQNNQDLVISNLPWDSQKKIKTKNKIQAITYCQNSIQGNNKTNTKKTKQP